MAPSFSEADLRKYEEPVKGSLRRANPLAPLTEPSYLPRTSGYENEGANQATKIRLTAATSSWNMEEPLSANKISKPGRENSISMRCLACRP